MAHLSNLMAKVCFDKNVNPTITGGVPFVVVPTPYRNLYPFLEGTYSLDYAFPSRQTLSYHSGFRFTPIIQSIGNLNIYNRTGQNYPLPTSLATIESGRRTRHEWSRGIILGNNPIFKPTSNPDDIFNDYRIVGSCGNIFAYNYDSTSTFTLNSSTLYKGGASEYTPSSDIELCRLLFYVIMYGSLVGLTISAEIWTKDGNNLDTLIYSSSIDGKEAPARTGFIPFFFTPPVTLYSGVPYAIVITTNNVSSSNYLQIRRGSTSSSLPIGPSATYNTLGVLSGASAYNPIMAMYTRY